MARGSGKCAEFSVNLKLTQLHLWTELGIYHNKRTFHFKKELFQDLDLTIFHVQKVTKIFLNQELKFLKLLLNSELRTQQKHFFYTREKTTISD